MCILLYGYIIAGRNAIFFLFFWLKFTLEAELKTLDDFIAISFVTWRSVSHDVNPIPLHHTLPYLRVHFHLNKGCHSTRLYNKISKFSVSQERSGNYTYTQTGKLFFQFTCYLLKKKIIYLFFSSLIADFNTKKKKKKRFPLLLSNTK